MIGKKGNDMTQENSLQHYISLRVRQLRLEKGISQEKLSEMADLSTKYIHNIENQHYNLKIQSLEKIMSALEVTPKEFFNFSSFDTENLLTLTDQLSSLPLDVQEQLTKAFITIVKQYDKK